MTSIEFVKKEFPNIEEMSSGDWLRKMSEFVAIKNSSINIEHLLSLKKNEKNAIEKAATVLMFNDNSDYKNALFAIIHFLTGIDYEDLTDEVISSISFLLSDEL